MLLFFWVSPLHYLSKSIILLLFSLEVFCTGPVLPRALSRTCRNTRPYAPRYGKCITIYLVPVEKLTLSYFNIRYPTLLYFIFGFFMFFFLFLLLSSSTNRARCSFHLNDLSPHLRLPPHKSNRSRHRIQIQLSSSPKLDRFVFTKYHFLLFRLRPWLHIHPEIQIQVLTFPPLQSHTGHLSHQPL